MIPVKLPENLENLLHHVCKETRHTHDYHIKKALQPYLEDLEDYLIASKRLKEYEAEGKKGLTLEEIEQKYNLKDV